MKTWDDLTAAALIGTERRAANLEAEGELGEALAELDAADRERALLKAAAITGAYRRAGYVPLTDGRSLPSSCEPETLPACNWTVARYLGLLLETPQLYHELLVECVQILVASGRRVPYEQLPALIDMAHTNVKLIPLVSPVIGQRGRWLVEQNPVWRKKAKRWSQDVPPEPSPDQLENLWSVPPKNSAEEPVLNILHTAGKPVWVKLAALHGHAFTWSADLVAAFLGIIKDELEHPFSPDTYFLSMVGRVPPPLIGDVLSRIRAMLGDKSDERLDTFLDMLKYRHDVLQELTR